MKDPITNATNELTEYIRLFDKKIFVPFFIFLLKVDTGTGNTYLNLTSKVQQILYLLRLFLNKEEGNKTDIDYKKIENLLESIEESYRDKLADTQINDYYDNNYRKSLAITGTYLNYFTNSNLVFIEQMIEKINATFGPLTEFIFQQTGVTVDDYIRFYLESSEISQTKFQNCYEVYLSQVFDKTEEGITCWSEINNLFLPYSLPLKLAINKLDYKDFDIDKLEKLFSFFSSYPGDCNTNYYCTFNVLWSKPFICLKPNEYYLPFNSQLLQSIYYFLYNICENKSKNRVSSIRANLLEKKTKRLFENYFKGYNPKILSNYYINFSECEKDLLVICKNIVLIIECKSKKYNEPFRNPDISYEKIKRDFKVSIQDAYRQVKEVEDLFQSQNEVIITDKFKNEIEVISTKKITQVVSIIVTQERFGQIQCDLGLLLDKEEGDFYPWSVSIDDLESVLLTFNRKENPYGVLSIYLSAREKLHERLICFDELDLVAHYLMQPETFLKMCNSNEVFVTSTDMCHFFDQLYQSGFGFENELGLEHKIRISMSSYLTYELCRKLKLKVPKNVSEYKSQNGITDTSMRIFGQMLKLSTTDPATKVFFESIRGKSLSYNDFDAMLSNS